MEEEIGLVVKQLSTCLYDSREVLDREEPPLPQSAGLRNRTWKISCGEFGDGFLTEVRYYGRLLIFFPTRCVKIVFENYATSVSPKIITTSKKYTTSKK
jgi:hypothetical protein